MKKLLLILPALAVGACSTGMPVLFPIVGMAGLAANEYNYSKANPGDEIDTVEEAADHIVDGVTEGFKGKTFTSHTLND